jgi:hypothetical protein
MVAGLGDATVTAAAWGIESPMKLSAAPTTTNPNFRIFESTQVAWQHLARFMRIACLFPIVGMSVAGGVAADSTLSAFVRSWIARPAFGLCLLWLAAGVVGCLYAFSIADRIGDRRVTGPEAMKLAVAYVRLSGAMQLSVLVMALFGVGETIFVVIRAILDHH